MNYLGIKHVRDDAENPADAGPNGWWQQFANATGAKFDAFMAEGSPAQVESDLNEAKQLAAQGLLEYIEGPNEEDDSYATSNGNNLQIATQQQAEVYQVGHSLGLPVINISFGFVNDYGSTGNLSNVADYANGHAYFGSGNNPGETSYLGSTAYKDGITEIDSLAETAAQGKPVINTESGYYTLNNGSGCCDVNDYVQGVYDPDILFDAYQDGATRTYIYEATDGNTGDGNSEDNFGVCNTDGSPKPAATAIHNIMSILADSGQCVSGSLDYSFSGMPPDGNSMLLRKSDGTYYLALWSNAKIGGPGATTVGVPTSPVTINLGATTQFTVYDPYQGTSPISTSSGSSVTVNLSDHLIFVEMSQGTVNPATLTTTTCTPTMAPAGAAASCPAQLITPFPVTGSLNGLPQIIAGVQATRAAVAAQVAAFSGTADQMTELQNALRGLDTDILALQNMETAATNLPPNPSPAEVSALQGQLTNIMASMAEHWGAINAEIATLDPAKDACLITILKNFYGPVMPAMVQADSSALSGLMGFIGNILTSLGVTSTSFAETAMQDLAHVADIDNSLSGNYIFALNSMTEQLTTIMMQQILIIGSFIDSENQLEAQRLLQDMDAQADKEYEPSDEMCVIGTNVRSLAMSDQKGKANAYILGNALLSRDMLPLEQEGGEGRNDDLVSRISQYEDKYCNPNDNDGMLGDMGKEKFLCKGTGGPQARRNRDIDYTDLVDGPLTLDVDFTDDTLTNDEEDILAMSHNLFGSDSFDTIPADILTEGPVTNMGPGAWIFQDWRSLEAIRGVAQNSFAHLVGMKAKGGGQVYPFMAQIVKEMGVPDADLQNFLSPVAQDGTDKPVNATNPSYFAQMDVLTKRLYMDPNFYTNLFTQPANVERVGVTLQAIKLMNDRDRFEASLRREMLISMIVEMKLRQQERETDNNLIGNLPALFVQ